MDELDKKAQAAYEAYYSSESVTPPTEWSKTPARLRRPWMQVAQTLCPPAPASTPAGQATPPVTDGSDTARASRKG